jgi:hypothetical protein
MASYRLNFARIQGCPKPAELGKLMEDFGLPESEEYGIINHSVADAACFGTLVRRTVVTFQKIEPPSAEITSGQIEKVTVYPFAVIPGKELLEIYAGSATGIKEIGAFFSSCLELATVVEPIEVDVPSAIEKLAKETKKFQLRSVRASDFAHNSFMIGPYTPKFADFQHGKDFLEQYAEATKSASVRFQGPTGKVTVSITPNACFAYSCNDDDPPTVKAILRSLVV